MNELSTRDKGIAQKLVANEFAAKEERKTMQQIAEECGVTRQTIYNKKQEPEFVAYMDRISYNALASHMAEIDAALMKAIRGGNNGLPSVKAIELAYKMTDRLSKETTVNHVHTSNKPRLSNEQIAAEIDDLNRMLQ
ncbi:MAG: phBC6A51 family helix-turn-helix protein [Parachlamydiaceae bacterium]